MSQAEVQSMTDIIPKEQQQVPISTSQEEENMFANVSIEGTTATPTADTTTTTVTTTPSEASQVTPATEEAEEAKEEQVPQTHTEVVEGAMEVVLENDDDATEEENKEDESVAEPESTTVAPEEEEAVREKPSLDSTENVNIDNTGDAMEDEQQAETPKKKANSMDNDDNEESREGGISKRPREDESEKEDVEKEQVAQDAPATIEDSTGESPSKKARLSDAMDVQSESESSVCME